MPLFDRALIARRLDRALAAGAADFLLRAPPKTSPTGWRW